MGPNIDFKVIALIQTHLCALLDLGGLALDLADLEVLLSDVLHAEAGAEVVTPDAEVLQGTPGVHLYNILVL